MIKGKLSNGFKFEIDDRIKSDVRFLEMVRNLNKLESKEELTKEEDAEHLGLLFDIVEKMLGIPQKEKLYKHIEEKDGFVDLVVLSQCLIEMMDIASKDEEVKN